MNLVRIENCRATVKQYLYCKSDLVLNYQWQNKANILLSARNTKKEAENACKKTKKVRLQYLCNSSF